MQTIDFKNFIAGKWQQQYQYQSFTPNKICLQWLISNPGLLNKLGEADRYLGRLDTFSELIPDIDFFIKMHVTKEATVSSKIEGTQTSFEEAFIKEAFINPDKRNDWQEVHNYIQALNQAIEAMRDLPISNRLIKQTHKTLLQGVRGKEKLPGEYRNGQNWIGDSLKDSIFIPPIHEEIPDLMQDLEQFINAEIMDLPLAVPHLIKIALAHYQFETIHPFLDGNGRIGRLLITLYLIDKELLQKPTLYLSDYFERNRRDYYDNLTQVRKKNDIENWLFFFLDGVIETAKKSIKSFNNIIKLRDDIELNRLIKLGRKQADGKRLINLLYKVPILDSKEVAKTLKIHSSTANRLIKDFEELKILTELTGYKRNRMYAFYEYIRIF
ncbi:MAG: Fic family protein [Flavobacteriaceae bacterium]|nr:Fic family protein [Flavobacteriaceae bacterium]